MRAEALGGQQLVLEVSASDVQADGEVEVLGGAQRVEERQDRHRRSDPDPLCARR